MESDNYRSKGAFLPLDYIERIELDAQRYRKLKAELQERASDFMTIGGFSFHKGSHKRFDEAVDALPEPK